MGPYRQRGPGRPRQGHVLRIEICQGRWPHGSEILPTKQTVCTARYAPICTNSETQPQNIIHNPIHIETTHELRYTQTFLVETLIHTLPLYCVEDSVYTVMESKSRLGDPHDLDRQASLQINCTCMQRGAFTARQCVPARPPEKTDVDRTSGMRRERVGIRSAAW